MRVTEQPWIFSHPAASGHKNRQNNRGQDVSQVLPWLGGVLWCCSVIGRRYRNTDPTTSPPTRTGKNKGSSGRSAPVVGVQGGKSSLKLCWEPGTLGGTRAKTEVFFCSVNLPEQLARLLARLLTDANVNVG